MAHAKICTFEELALRLTALRAEHKRIVHCHGVFDLLHVGHIRHFAQARGFGDVLVVTVTPDIYVNKGPDRPAFHELLRAEALAALASVDLVAINQGPMALEAITLIRPDFYVKGSDYRDAAQDVTGGITLEETTVKAHGGQLVFTDEMTFSSSKLLNRYFAPWPPEVSDFMRGFGQRYPSEQVLQSLAAIRNLRTLVIGETIIDEYHYCETLGKSGKEPVLAARYMRSEQFAGGILAVANHAANFCDHVGMVTFLGAHESQEAFIRAKLNPAIKANLLTMANAPTIVKRRFVETYPFQKLFEVYVMDDGERSQPEIASLNALLQAILPSYDVVIVTDYGHGMLTPETIALLCEQAPFLAVNTQVNAGNHGFNTVAKYPHADYICVSEKEIRLEARQRYSDLRAIIEEVAARINCPQLLITRGKQGCLCYHREHGFFEIPSFAGQVVDRIGAGDAVFAITAMCAARQVPSEMLGFIGNAVGAQAVGIVGNQHAINRVALLKHIDTLLK